MTRDLFEDDINAIAAGRDHPVGAPLPSSAQTIRWSDQMASFLPVPWVSPKARR